MTTYIKKGSVIVAGKKKIVYKKKGSTKSYVIYKKRYMNLVKYKKLKSVKKPVKKNRGGVWPFSTRSSRSDDIIFLRNAAKELRNPTLSIEEVADILKYGFPKPFGTGRLYLTKNFYSDDTTGSSNWKIYLDENDHELVDRKVINIKKYTDKDLIKILEKPVNSDIYKNHILPAVRKLTVGNY